MRTTKPIEQNPSRWLFLLLCALIGVQFYATSLPTNSFIGIDDANITQVYARHLAQGHGYVYNIGGEWVEGSTSLLWTLINTAFFLTSFPYALLLVTSILTTAALVWICARLTLLLGGTSGDAAVSMLVMAFFPTFFGWLIWSYMDTGLFTLLICLVLLSLVEMQSKPADRLPAATLLICCVLLPLARPEGLVVALGTAPILLFGPHRHGKIRFVALLAGAAIITFAAVTLWRLSMFGVPLPNTVYAKTSTDLAGQFQQGLSYVDGFLTHPRYLPLLILFLLGFIVLRKNRLQRIYLWIMLYLLVSAFLLYALSGGDHFYVHRFFLFAIPLLAPIAALVLGRLIARAPGQMGRIGLAGLLILAAGLQLNGYIANTARHNDFQVAIRGRLVGERLEHHLGTELSYASVAAGGIKMGYGGHVYDLLGLNWRDMALSHEATDTTMPKNHGGYTDKVFFEAAPDLAFGRLWGCDLAPQQILTAFEQRLTGTLTENAKFMELYRPYCTDDLTLYALRIHDDKLRALGFQPYDLEDTPQNN